MISPYHSDLFPTVVINPLGRHKEHVVFEEYANKNRWVGRSATFDTKGALLGVAEIFESNSSAIMRGAVYCEGGQLPGVRFVFYRHVVNQYCERYDPNMWLSYVPKGGADATQYLKGEAPWTSASSEE